jgi:Mn2+/Fe2+ NRAMP family transporter
MGVMMLMAARTDIMGRFAIGFRLKVLGWISTGVMAIAVATMFWTFWK